MFSALQVMQQQSNIAAASGSMTHGRQPPQQFSRAYQQPQSGAAINRSMASSQNMQVSSSQQMAPPPSGQQYFSVIEVQNTAW